MKKSLLLFTIFTFIFSCSENGDDDSTPSVSTQEEISYNFFFQYEGFSTDRYTLPRFNNPYYGTRTIVTESLDASESTCTDTYDENGFRTTRVFSNGVTYDYSYNANDFAGDALKSDTKGPFEIRDYTFDDNWSRLTEKIYDYDDNTLLWEQIYERNTNSMKTSSTYKDYDDDPGYISVCTYTFYSDDVPLEYTFTENGTLVKKMTFTIESDRAVKRDTYVDGTLTYSRSYTYDSLGRVCGYTSHNYETSKDYSAAFTYLSDGGPIQEGVLYDITDGVSNQDYLISYTFDSNGRTLTVRSYDYVSGTAVLDEDNSFNYTYTD